jgi:electron transfer flavoprotein alpha/beta subunit
MKSGELRIVVCVRPPEADSSASGLSPHDLSALEYAVRLAHRDGGRVTVVATGGGECLSVLREGIARGADASVHVAEVEQSTDPIETARRLHWPVRDLKPSLVLCGTRSAVGMHGEVGRALAGLLGLPFIGSIVELDIESDQGTARAVQALGRGDRWSWGAKLPLVVGVEKELCSPRYLAVRRACRVDGHLPVLVASTLEAVTGDDAQLGALLVQGRSAPRIRPKKSKVATATMSASDRMKMLRGGGAQTAAGAPEGDDPKDDPPKRITGDAEDAAREIVALLEKREVLQR